MKKKKQKNYKRKTQFPKTVSFRLTEKQYNMLETKIKNFGINKSDVFRNITNAILKEQITSNLLITSKN